jgi:heme A synthase
VTDLHRFIGYAIPTGFGILVLWTVYCFFRNRPPHDWFWSLLAVLQVVIGVQFVVGGIMYLSGDRPHPNGPEFLHYVYGAFFPGLVLVVAHRLARRRFAEIPWAVFGVAAFVCCFSTIRAIQTGLGID